MTTFRSSEPTICEVRRFLLRVESFLFVLEAFYHFHHVAVVI